MTMIFIKDLRLQVRSKGHLSLKVKHGHCLGPLGERDRLFLLSLLRHWSEINAGASKYKVWKVGQSEEYAILLNDAISQILPVKSEKN
ncbi:hypothetical protein PVL29_016256 [Vitis rotundifolia]|uniref:Uncharacterized protein n=1 Tax=Vitis rotundifolia TaxID=103349 RepID=A0AA38ZER3_VITRO|nr:hypothetical protein PVL29_016256 [Vitis rotundifolia]